MGEGDEMVVGKNGYCCKVPHQAMLKMSKVERDGGDRGKGALVIAMSLGGGGKKKHLYVGGGCRVGINWVRSLGGRSEGRASKQ